MGLESYPEWIRLVADFTISSLNSWQWASGSVYYLLGLWWVGGWVGGRQRQQRCCCGIRCLTVIVISLGHPAPPVVMHLLGLWWVGGSEITEALFLKRFSLLKPPAAGHGCAQDDSCSPKPAVMRRSRLISSMPYLKGDAPSLLDTFVPKITHAYITSRLDSVRAVAANGATEDPLDNDEQLQVGVTHDTFNRQSTCT